MTGRNLWYVRRDGKVAGPFPSQVITNHILMGRVRSGDEVSMDQLVWRPVAEVHELLPHELIELHAETDPEHRLWLEERLKAARRWADDRTHQERHDLDESDTERRKSAGDPDMLVMAHQHPLPVSKSSRRAYLIAGMVATVLLLTVLALIYLQPVNPVKVGVVPAQPQCRQAAAPGVNWGGCDKQDLRMRGVDLSGANLSYANLSYAGLSGSSLRRAKLVGANLSGADLNDTDLEGADLSYADLHDASLVSATLKDANLEHAIWTDGRLCAAGSRGECR